MCAGTFGSIKNNHVSHVDMLADTNVTASLDCAGDKTYYRNCFSECEGEMPGWCGSLDCSVPLTSVRPALLAVLPCAPLAVPAQTAIILMVVGGLAFSGGIFLILLCCGCCKCCNEKGGELPDATWRIVRCSRRCAQPGPAGQAPVSHSVVVLHVGPDSLLTAARVPLSVSLRRRLQVRHVQPLLPVVLHLRGQAPARGGAEGGNLGGALADGEEPEAEPRVRQDAVRQGGGRGGGAEPDGVRVSAVVARPCSLLPLQYRRPAAAVGLLRIRRGRRASVSRPSLPR